MPKVLPPPVIARSITQTDHLLVYLDNITISTPGETPCLYHILAMRLGGVYDQIFKLPEHREYFPSDVSSALSAQVHFGKEAA